jgi:hypothetical protein
MAREWVRDKLLKRQRGPGLHDEGAICKDCAALHGIVTIVFVVIVHGQGGRQ